MATLKLTGQVRDTTSGSQTTYGSSNVSVTMTGAGEDRRVVNVGTSEETYTISTDIGDCGLCLLENKDDTNFVQVGFATTAYYIRLQPGEPYVFRLEPSVTAFYMKADTAACNVLFHVFED